MQNHHDTKNEFTARAARLGLVSYFILALIITLLVPL